MVAPEQIQTDISAPTVQVQDPGVEVGGIEASPDAQITTTGAPQVSTPEVNTPELSASDGGVSVGGSDAPAVDVPQIRAPETSAPSGGSDSGGSGGGPVATQPVIEPPELKRPKGGDGQPDGGVAPGVPDGEPRFTTQPIELPQISAPGGGSDSGGSGGRATTQPVELPQINAPGGGSGGSGSESGEGVTVGGSDGSPFEIPEISAPQLNRTNRPRGGNTGRSGRRRDDRGGGSGGGSSSGPNGLQVIVQSGRVEDFKTGFLVNEELVNEDGRTLTYRVTGDTPARVMADNLRSLVLVESIQAVNLSGGGGVNPAPPPETPNDGVVVEVKPGEVFNFTASFLLSGEKIGQQNNILLYRTGGTTPPSTLAADLSSREIVRGAQAVDLSEYSLPSGGSSAGEVQDYGKTLVGLAEALNNAINPLKTVQRTYPEEIANTAAQLESDVRSMVKALNEEISRVRAWLEKNTAQPATSGLTVGGGLEVGSSAPSLNVGGGASVPALNAGGGASVPALDAGDGASVPALDAGAGASVPRLRSGDGQSVDVGGVTVGGSLPEINA